MKTNTLIIEVIVVTERQKWCFKELRGAEIIAGDGNPTTSRQLSKP